MVTKYNTKSDPNVGIIVQDGNIKTPELNGKIVKVLVLTNRQIDTLRIDIESLDYEPIIDTSCEQPINVFYPFNDIARVTPEQGFADYFYVDGPVFITVRGLRQGDVVKEIRIYTD